jgi:hypothetical protein
MPSFLQRRHIRFSIQCSRAICRNPEIYAGAIIFLDAGSTRNTRSQRLNSVCSVSDSKTKKSPSPRAFQSRHIAHFRLGHSRINEPVPDQRRLSDVRPTDRTPHTSAPRSRSNPSRARCVIRSSKDCGRICDRRCARPYLRPTSCDGLRPPCVCRGSPVCWLTM